MVKFIIREVFTDGKYEYQLIFVDKQHNIEQEILSAKSPERIDKYPEKFELEKLLLMGIRFQHLQWE